MAKDRFPSPPPPSLPKEAPWREVEEVIYWLRIVAWKLGAPGVPGAPGAPGVPGAPAFVVRKNLPTFWTGQKDVTTAGTPVQLDDLVVPDGYEVTVIAKPGNTGLIYIGKDKADCANNKRRFDGLSAGLAISQPVSNVNAFWVDAEVNDEGVSWIVAQPQ